MIKTKKKQKQNKTSKQREQMSREDLRKRRLVGWCGWRQKKKRGVGNFFFLFFRS